MSNKDYKGLPKDIRPISSWGYFGMNLLFCIPILGFVFLILFSFSEKNIHRRNYARSFFIPIIIFLILLATILIALSATGLLTITTDIIIEEYTTLLA